MKTKTILKKVREAYSNGRRLVAPLMGFPGLQMIDSNIKVAQQNYGIHFNAIKALVKEFEPDVAFPLMDLSVEVNALGRYTVFPKEDTPTVPKDTFGFEELEKLKNIGITYDTRLLGYVETVKLMHISLKEETVIGAYVAGPYSMAGLIMGADNASLATILEPDKLDELCKFTTERILEYIRLLTSAGAQAICILEPSSVMLGPDEFERFSARYVKDICNNYKYSDISIIYHVCGNTMHLTEMMVDSGVDALSLDSPSAGIDLPAAAKRIKNETILIGNIDPTGTILTGTPEQLEEEVIQLLKSMDFFENFVLSTGCDLPQKVPLENITAFMKAGKNYRVK